MVINLGFPQSNLNSVCKQLVADTTTYSLCGFIVITPSRYPFCVWLCELVCNWASRQIHVVSLGGTSFLAED